jgi:hypothetical protein
MACWECVGTGRTSGCARAARLIAGLLLTLAFASTGCSADPGSPPGMDTEARPTYRTVVRLGPGGEEVVFQGSVSASQRQAELRAHLDRSTQGGSEDTASVQEAIERDWNCYGSSIWIWDISDGYYGNPDHEICFSGSGTANLGSYCLVGTTCWWWQTWSGRVRSFWAGSSAGLFGSSTPYCCGGACALFYTYEYHSTASSCEEGASHVHVGSNCVPCSPPP